MKRLTDNFISFNLNSLDITPPDPLTANMLTPPVLTGPNPADVGDTLTFTFGTYEGYPVPQVETFLIRGGVNVGAVTSPYVTVQADDDETLHIRQTVTNAGGTSSMDSLIGIAVNDIYEPSNTSVPVITGTATVGQVLSCSTGGWDASPSATFVYQWRRNGVNIAGATSSTYTLVAADETTVITCRVTATNSEGNDSATSAGTDPVGPEANFLPTDLTGLKAWYDPSDASTITETATAVSQLDDKSGNGYHAVQTIESNKPFTSVDTINSLNVLTLDNTGRHLDVPNAVFAAGAKTVFIMHTPDSTSGNDWVMSSYNQNFRILNHGVSVGTDVLSLPSANRSTTDPVLQIQGYNGLFTTFLKINDFDAFNGVGSSTVASNATGLAGWGGSTGFSYDGRIGEVVVYERYLTIAETNQVAQYFADKWGATVTAISEPSSIDPSTLDNKHSWYDPSDASTVTESAGSVSGLANKFGNTLYDLTQTTASRQPQIASGVLSFDGGDWLEHSNPGLWDAGACTVFVVTSDYVYVNADTICAETGSSDYYTFQRLTGSGYVAAQTRMNNTTLLNDNRLNSFAPLPTAKTIQMYTDDGGEMMYYENGARGDNPRTYTRDAGYTASLDRFALGGRVLNGGNDRTINCKVFEFIAYTDQLTDVEINGISKYLADKHNITHEPIRL